MGKNIGKNISKNLNNKYSQKLLDRAKKSATDVFKTSSKIVIQKTSEATALIGNKIANRITKISRDSQQNISEFLKQLQMNMIKKYLKKDINLEEKDKKLLMILILI